MRQGVSQRILGPKLRLKVISTIYEHNFINLMHKYIDLQNVGLEVRILYRPQVENLVALHRTLGPDFDDRVLTSIV